MAEPLQRLRRSCPYCYVMMRTALPLLGLFALLALAVGWLSVTLLADAIAWLLPLADDALMALIHRVCA